MPRAPAPHSGFVHQDRMREALSEAGGGALVGGARRSAAQGGAAVLQTQRCRDEETTKNTMLNPSRRKPMAAGMRMA